MVGTSLGHYQVTARLGAGGMGEVWRARDTRLDREVAVKILPKDFAQSADRLRRFQQEAKTLAALQHPNILVIFDVGQHEGEPYLVSELLEGHTLRDELASGPLSPRKALEYSLQIAAGLAAAHERNIIHRDLKPENVFVTKEGRIKVLDFGLAKLHPESPSLPDPIHAEPGTDSEAATVPSSHPITGASASTVPGVALGTPSYMSPEQVRGENLDARSDIFSLGTLLFEMLTGEQAFRRRTRVESMSAILRDDLPELSELVPHLPAALDRLVRRCVEREPERRWQNARDLAFAIENMSAFSSAVLPSLRAKRFWFTDLSPWVLAGVFALAWLGTLLWATRKPSSRQDIAAFTHGPPPLRKLEIPLPNTTNGPASLSGLAISPDGMKLLYVADGNLWLHWLDRRGAPVLLARKDVGDAFWSPRSTELAFYKDARLWTVSVSGGDANPICSVGGPQNIFRSGAWMADGQILFSMQKRGTTADGIYGVASLGGDPRLVLPLEEGMLIPSIRPLPGGRGIIFACASSQSMQGSIDIWTEGGKRKTLLQVPYMVSFCVFVPPAHVLFNRMAGDAISLIAFPFAVGRLERTGEPFSIPAGVAGCTAADDGTVLGLKVEGEALFSRRLVWLDRAGNVTGTIGNPVEGLAGIRLSPDGKRILGVAYRGLVLENFVLDVARGTAMPLSRFQTNDSLPAWMPDSRTVLFTRREDHPRIIVQDIDGLGIGEALLEGSLKASSGDGKHLIYTRSIANRSQLVYSSFQDRGRNPTPLDSLGDPTYLRLSPDGSLLAFIIENHEIYVLDFPGLTNRTLIARGGISAHLRWASNGSELFYLQDSALMSLPVQRGGARQLGQPVKLYDVPPYLEPLSFDVAPSGDRFVWIQTYARDSSAPLQLVSALLIENWFEEFRAKQPPK